MIIYIYYIYILAYIQQNWNISLEKKSSNTMDFQINYNSDCTKTS